MSIHPARSDAMLLRDEIARLDLPHRKGFRLSNFDGQKPTLEHLDGEIRELRDAIDHEPLANQREELADVFACVLQVAARLGMTFDDLDREATRKLRLRFLGAADIALPERHSETPAPATRIP